MQPNFIEYQYFCKRCNKFPVAVNSINGADFSLNETETITITGEWFTPGITVLIENQTVNSINYIDFNTIKVNVTSGNVIGDFDIAIAGKIYPDTFKVSNYITLIPGNGTTNWVRVSNNVTTNIGEIMPNVYSSGWNQAGSFGTVSANKDFELKFNAKLVQSNEAGMCGVDNSDPNFYYNTIDYAIFFTGGNIYIYEKGSSKGSYGAYNESDLFSIERYGNTITYLKNGNVFYTSLNKSTSQMVFDNSIYRYIGFTNIKLRYPA